jgi:hypothetical protein
MNPVFAPLNIARSSFRQVRGQTDVLACYRIEATISSAASRAKAEGAVIASHEPLSRSGATRTMVR